MSILVNSAFTSIDVEVLRNALNTWCAEKKVDIDSSEAQSAASVALDLFQSGHNTRDSLLTAMRGFNRH